MRKETKGDDLQTLDNGQNKTKMREEHNDVRAKINRMDQLDSIV
jgi:hypothetical protein